MASVCDGCSRPPSACSPLTKIACGLKKKRLVVFCGAGVSASVLPVASEYIREHWGVVRVPWDQVMTAYGNEASLWRDLVMTFGPGRDIPPTEAHRWLAHLGARHYVCTNYDLLLETALERFAGRQEVAVVRDDTELPRVSGRSVSCVKLHGDVARSTPTHLLVLSEKHYSDRIIQPLRVDHFVSFLFATHAVLFVGYSLTDSNIVALLNADKRLGAAFERFALLADEDAFQERRLSELGVTAIPLDVGLNASSAEKTAALNRCLRSIWEQTDALGDFLINMQEPKPTVGEVLATAIKDRKDNNLERAREGFDELWRRVDELKQQPKLFPRFLWLLVSLHDKTEEWDRLAELDQFLVSNQLLRILPSFSPETVCLMVEAVYRGALAVAKLRELDFDGARTNVEQALQWEPGLVARGEHHLLYANLLTAKALVGYCTWRTAGEEGAKQSLDQATKCLEEAAAKYDQYANEGQEDECHHLGRFYGTRALVALARGDEKSALDDAERAHTARSQNPKARSRFGRVAGRYCHALVLYEISRSQGHPAGQLYLNGAVGLVEAALPEVKEKQQRVRTKLESLRARIRWAAGHPGVFDEFDDPTVLRDLEDRGLSVETWLTLPLN